MGNQSANQSINSLGQQKQQQRQQQQQQQEEEEAGEREAGRARVWRLGGCGEGAAAIDNYHPCSAISPRCSTQQAAHNACRDQQL